MHEVLVNRFGGLSLLRKSVVRLTDRPDMTLDVCANCITSNLGATVKVNNCSLGEQIISFKSSPQ